MLCFRIAPQTLSLPLAAGAEHKKMNLTAATEGRSPKVDEDWGKASIFINLAYRRYLKMVGIGSHAVAFPFTP